MQKLGNTLVNMSVVLTVVAIVTGGVLAYVNDVTSEPISQQKRESLASGIKAVMQDNNLQVVSTDTIKKTETDGKEYTYVVYGTTNSKGEPLGKAVESTTMGFGGALKVLIGFSATGDIKGYTILGTQETPGLGAKADQWFQAGNKGNIIDKNPGNDNLTVNKDGGVVDAITASTITSRAFLKAVNQAYSAVQETSTEATTGAKVASETETNEQN